MLNLIALFFYLCDMGLLPVILIFLTRDGHHQVPLQVLGGGDNSASGLQIEIGNFVFHEMKLIF